MVYAKLQDHGTSSSKFVKVFYIWVWQPSCSCYHGHSHRNMSPSQGGSTYNLALIGQACSEKK